MNQINHIVIHCSATQNGVPATKKCKAGGAVWIDQMHQERGFHRSELNRAKFNPHLKAIGYHFIIDLDGKIETGRAEWEQGAHVKGHNRSSLGICLIGGKTVDGKTFGRYSRAQWNSLKNLLIELSKKYPTAEVLGHRDFPNVNKACPSFEVKNWLKNQADVEAEHIWRE